MVAGQIDQNAVFNIEKSLRVISGIIKQKDREILREYTITPPQFIALQKLLEDGDMTIGELSNKMFLACSTTTDLVDRMEKTNLVERVRNPKDRRVVSIHLLNEGKRIIDEVIEKRQDYLKGILSDWSHEEVKSLHRTLLLLSVEMNKGINN